METITMGEVEAAAGYLYDWLTDRLPWISPAGDPYLYDIVAGTRRGEVCAGCARLALASGQAWEVDQVVLWEEDEDVRCSACGLLLYTAELYGITADACRRAAAQERAAGTGITADAARRAAVRARLERERVAACYRHALGV